VRWIVFDDETAEAVVTRLRRGAAEIQHTDPVDAALSSPKPSLVILPSNVAGRVFVARFNARKPEAPASVKSKALARPIAATAHPKKAWWKKLVA